MITFQVQIYIDFFQNPCKIVEKFGGLSMKNTIYFMSILLILTVVTISQATADDKQQTNSPKKIQKQTAPTKQKNSTIEKKLDDLILKQNQYQKSIQRIDKGLDQQASFNKQFQTEVTQKFKIIQQQIKDQLKQVDDLTKGSKEQFRSDFLKIDNQLQILQTNMFESLSIATQNFNEILQAYRKDQDNQMNNIRTFVQDVQTNLISEQANRYSAIELSRNQLNSKIETMFDKLSKFQNQISQDQPDFQQILNNHVTAQQDRLDLIETNVKNLITNSNAQLNSDINDTIRQLKNDVNRFKQDIDDTMTQVSGQVLEIKHEQQIELQSLVKQLTKELNRHDQNISENLVKAEQTLDTNHLTWIIYGLFCLIIGLIGFIIWDRNTTVAPLIARIRKLEDNLVIDY